MHCKDCIDCVGRLILLFSKYSYGRDVVEPAIKPGEAALVCKLAIAHTHFLPFRCQEMIHMSTDRLENKEKN